MTEYCAVIGPALHWDQAVIGPALYRAMEQTAVKKLPDPFPLLQNEVWPHETNVNHMHMRLSE